MPNDRHRCTRQNCGSKTESTHEGAEVKLLSPLEDLSLVGLAGGRLPAESGLSMPVSILYRFLRTSDDWRT